MVWRVSFDGVAENGCITHALQWAKNSDYHKMKILPLGEAYTFCWRISIFVQEYLIIFVFLQS